MEEITMKTEKKKELKKVKKADVYAAKYLKKWGESLWLKKLRRNNIAFY